MRTFLIHLITGSDVGDIIATFLEARSRALQLKSKRHRLLDELDTATNDLFIALNSFEAAATEMKLLTKL